MTDTTQEDINSKKMIMFSIAAVFVANLAILGYAVHMSTGHGEEHAAPTHTSTAAGGGQATVEHATPGGGETGTDAGATGGAATDHVVSTNASAEKGQEKYMMFCSPCHGTSGTGDGPAAIALDPKPRNHTDPEWQAKTPDDQLRKVISQGGMAVGLSPLMAGFPQLTGEELDSLVLFIRTLDSSK